MRALRPGPYPALQRCMLWPVCCGVFHVSTLPGAASRCASQLLPTWPRPLPPWAGSGGRKHHAPAWGQPLRSRSILHLEPAALPMPPNGFPPCCGRGAGVGVPVARADRRVSQRTSGGAPCPRATTPTSDVRPTPCPPAALWEFEGPSLSIFHQRPSSPRNGPLGGAWRVARTHWAPEVRWVLGAWGRKARW